jgi:hypothetical protein
LAGEGRRRREMRGRRRRRPRDDDEEDEDRHSADGYESPSREERIQKFEETQRRMEEARWRWEEYVPRNERDTRIATERMREIEGTWTFMQALAASYGDMLVGRADGGA